MQTPEIDEYPVGQTWLFDLGEGQVEHIFSGPGVLHYRVVSGPREGQEDTVPLHVERIRSGVFLVSWLEHDGIVVVHVEDYGRNAFHSHVLHPGGTLMRFRGVMRRLR